MSKYLSVIGNVGKLSAERTTHSGKVVDFSLAQDHWDGTTTWFRVSVFEDNGADAARDLRPGQVVAVNGRYSSREWGGKIQHELIADSLLPIEWPAKAARELPF